MAASRGHAPSAGRRRDGACRLHGQWLFIKNPAGDFGLFIKNPAGDFGLLIKNPAGDFGLLIKKLSHCRISRHAVKRANYVRPPHISRTPGCFFFQVHFRSPILDTPSSIPILNTADTCPVQMTLTAQGVALCFRKACSHGDKPAVQPGQPHTPDLVRPVHRPAPQAGLRGGRTVYGPPTGGGIMTENPWIGCGGARRW